MITTPVGYLEPAYKLTLTRLDGQNRRQIVEFDYYGVLQELLDDLLANHDVQRWIEESRPEPWADASTP